MTTVLTELAQRFGPDGCLQGQAMRDAGGLWDRSENEVHHEPLAVLRPRNTQEVAEALALCHRHGQSVVPQGGLTGLAGGANPRSGDVVLSLSRFAGVEDIDPLAGAMTVRAGTVLQTAQDAAAAAGFLLPIDLGARGSCQIGGVIATNAGGIRVLRQGTTRQNLLGLEAVLADGTVLSHLSKVKKDNTGYDLTQLIAGSEGTLAVITRAVIALRPLPGVPETALCALPDFASVMRLLDTARRALTLSAFELMWREHLVMNGGGDLFDVPPPFAVLIECEGQGLQDLLETCFEQGIVTDALLAQSVADARRFWDVREGHSKIIQLHNVVNLDVSLALGDMESFGDELLNGCAALDPGIVTYLFGHAADGNLHVMATLPEPDPMRAQEVERIAYALVRARGGSISAEHGIGTHKRPWLGYSRSAAEINVMRAIKAALDPAGLLNPGKVL